MQLTVPGTSSAGRDRLLPWAAMYRISPLKPSRSQSRKCASSAAKSMLATPMRANPSSVPQRLMSASNATGSNVRESGSWRLTSYRGSNRVGTARTVRIETVVHVEPNVEAATRAAILPNSGWCAREPGMAESDLRIRATRRRGHRRAGRGARQRAAGRIRCAAHGGYAVLYLHGELGAGKTACVRSLLRARGVTGLIRSPTFTLVEAYRTGASLACTSICTGCAGRWKWTSSVCGIT